MITEKLRLQATQLPDNTALSDGTRKLTYRELSLRVDALSEWITAQGINVLAIDIDNGFDWVIADLASMNAGITIVPVPGFFTPPQIRHLLDQAQVEMILGTDGIVAPGLFEARLKKTGRTASHRIPCKVTFTSGSTGNPKGVVLTHETLYRVTKSIVAAMTLIDVQRHLCLLPLATLLENVAGIYAPLLKGIEAIVPSPLTTGLSGSSRIDLEQFAQCLSSTRPDSIILVPQLLMALATMIELGSIPPWPIKMIPVGGGKVSRALLEKASRLHLPVYEGYGLSEAGSVTTLNLPGDHLSGSVGKPLPHAGLRVSAEGEIEVSGTLFEGYLGDAPFNQDWLPTGDMGRIDDEGFVHIDGRLKNIFVTSFGRNVNPEWVEAELAQSPMIENAMVYGEGMPSGVALLWPRFALDDTAAQEIIDATNERMPDYAAIEHFILMDEPLPDYCVTANGRLKRAAVINTFWKTIEPYTPSHQNHA